MLRISVPSSFFSCDEVHFSIIGKAFSSNRSDTQLLSRAPAGIHVLLQNGALCSGGVQWATREAPSHYSSQFRPYQCEPTFPETRPVKVLTQPRLAPDCKVVSERLCLKLPLSSAAVNARRNLLKSVPCRSSSTPSLPKQRN